MPNRSKYFQGGNFLKATSKDEEGEQIVHNGMLVTVEKFEEIKTRLSETPRPCLRFRGIEQPFGLNATNFDKMIEKFGENEKNWTGKKVRLRITTAPNPSEGGKEGPALRIE